MNLLYIVWDVNPIAFHIVGSLDLRWYSLFWCIGLLLVYVLMHKLFREQKLSEEQFDPMFVYCFFGILVGARLGHCLLYEPGYFLSSGTHIIEMLIPFRLLADGQWHFTGYEGLASHGGTLGLFILLYAYSRKVKISFTQILDNVGIVTPICACFIRLGNLMNSEIIGRITDVPWAFRFLRSQEALSTLAPDGLPLPRHPGQLYEAICYLIFFFIGWWIYKRSLNGLNSLNGSKGSMFLVGSGFYFGLCIALIFTARIFIEFTKANQEAWENDMLLNMGQLLSIPYVLIGVGIIIRAFYLNRKIK